MLTKEKDQIIKDIESLPLHYQKEIFDFIEFIRKRARESDNEYLRTLPGMVESIKQAMDEDPNESLTLEDIGWEGDV